MLVLARRLERGPIVANELVGSVVSVAATVAAVFVWNPGGFREVLAGRIPNLPLDESLVWTIVIGSVAGKLTCAILTYFLSPGGAPRLDWEQKSVREVLSFGRWVLLSTAITFFAGQGDRLLAPTVAGFEGSGLYGRAVNLVAIATGLIIALSNSIILPLIGRAREHGEKFASIAKRVALLCKIAGATLLTGLLAAGPSMVSLLYPATYSGVTWVLQVLAVVGWFQCHSAIASATVLGMGEAKRMMVGNFAKLAGLALAAFPAVTLARHFGWNPLSGVLISVACGELCRYVAFVVIGMRLRVWSVMQDVFTAAGVALATLVAMQLGGRIVPLFLDGPPVHKVDWLISFVVYGTLAVVLWGLATAVLWKTGRIRFRLDSAK